MTETQLNNKNKHLLNTEECGKMGNYKNFTRIIIKYEKNHPTKENRIKKTVQRKSVLPLQS